MATNGRRRTPRARIELTSGAADEREAAAVIAAIEQFLGETAPSPRPAEQVTPWQRAALLEGVSAKQRAFPADPGSGLPL